MFLILGILIATVIMMIASGGFVYAAGFAGGSAIIPAIGRWMAKSENKSKWDIFGAIAIIIVACVQLFSLPDKARAEFIFSCSNEAIKAQSTSERAVAETRANRYCACVLENVRTDFTIHVAVSNWRQAMQLETHPFAAARLSEVVEGCARAP